MTSRRDQSKEICFIIGPIGAEGSDIRDHADWVAEAVERALAPKYDVIRADRIKSPGLITDQVIDFIDRAGIIVADLAELNPNAFYELGIAHAARKRVVHVFPTEQRLPFDIQEYRAVDYKLNSPAEIVRLSRRIAEQVSELESQSEPPSNPVTRARGLRGLAATGDQKDQIIASMAMQLSAVEARLRSLERTSNERLIDALSGAGGLDIASSHTDHGEDTGRFFGGVFGEKKAYSAKEVASFRRKRLAELLLAPTAKGEEDGVK